MRGRLVVALMLLATTRQAQASEPALERPVRYALTSLAPANAPLVACGGDDALRGAVEERLHRPAFTRTEDADYTFTIELEDGGSRARILERDRTGEELGRRDVPMPDGDCDKAIDTLAVVLAIMIGPPRMVLEVSAPQPVAGRAEPPPGSPPPSAPNAPTRGRWDVSPTASLAVGGGILHGVAWGVEGGVLVRPPRSLVSLAARAAYWPPRSTGARELADVNRLSFALAACAELVRPRPFAVDLCTGADVGRLHATTSSLTRASDSTLLLAALVEGRITYRFERRGLAVEPTLAVQIAALLRRDRFTYREVDGRESTLLQPAPVAFQTSLGFLVHFW